MQNKNRVLITGSTDGIGKSAAILLAKRGYRVIVHGRNREKVQTTVEEIREMTQKSEIEGIVADFEDLRQVEEMADEVNRRYNDISILINNAGVFEDKRRLTKDGFEATFQINHLSHFLLTLKLLDTLKKNEPSYIINVSSMVHASSYDKNNIQGENRYDGYTAYSVSKLFNVLFTYKLADMLKEYDVHVYAVHPGVINTKLLIKGWGPVGTPPEVGAENITSPILNEALRKKTGIYVMGGKPAKFQSIAYDKNEQEFLWDYSLKLLKERGIKI